MRAEFDVSMTTGKMYDYMLRHAFTSFAGIVGEILGIVLIVGFFVYDQWIHLICGVFCLLYQPIALWFQAKKQVQKNEVFATPLHYVVDETGITVKSGENTDSMPWEKMYKAVSTSRSVILYTNRVNACIFPKEDMGEAGDTVCRLIHAHMDAKQVNIR